MFRTAFTLLTVLWFAISAQAQDAAKVKESRQKAINFLKTTQAADGSWTSPTQPGISGLVVYSLIESGVPVDDPAVAKGLKHLESFAQPDGGLYEPNTAHKNYETSIIVLALEAANQDGRYTATLKKAVEFLKSIQWDDAEGSSPGDAAFGGQGYGRSKRPDLSNTSFFLDALQAAGVSQSDPSYKNALVFVSRCQNRKSEENSLPFADKINDGGFYYTPAGGGASFAGGDANTGLRSYGSMTYAGVKSMIYAGLTSDDPRVKAATEWLAKTYTMDENPGMGQAGLYYYYHSAAKALTALKTDEFKDAKGVSHKWKTEMATKLLSLQKDNGSWVNDANRWLEGDPNIVSAYALLALRLCSPVK